MRTSTLRALLVLAVLLACLAPSNDGRASCAAPQPEQALLTTPTNATVPAGGALVMYLSERALAEQLVLEPEGQGAAVPLVRRELAPHVYAVDIPVGTSAGRYAVVSRARRRRGTPWTAGTVVVGGTRVERTLPAPSGRLVRRSSPGRWAPNEGVLLELTTPPPADVAVVFRWTDGSGAHGNARWAQAGVELAAAQSGHCGTFPYGVTVPSAQTVIEVAFVDARGVLGPWASMTVR